MFWDCDKDLERVWSDGLIEVVSIAVLELCGVYDAMSKAAVSPADVGRSAAIACIAVTSYRRTCLPTSHFHQPVTMAFLP